MKQQVYYHNYLNSFGLKDFDEQDLNIFFFLIRELKNKNENNVTLSFKEIRENSNVKLKVNHILALKLSSILSKLMRISLVKESINENGELYKAEFVIFQSYIVDENKKTLTISCSKDALFLFNDLTRNFTKLDFQNYLNISSKYIKEIYRRLKQFDNTGFWKVNYQDFLELLDVPKTYSTGMVKKQIVDLAIKEILPIYPNLKVNYIYEKNTGKKGRPKVKTLEFIWKETYLLINGQKVDAETGEIIHKRKQIEEELPVPELKYLSDEEMLLIQEFRSLKSSEKQSQKEKNKKVPWANEEVYSILNKKFQKE